MNRETPGLHTSQSSTHECGKAECRRLNVKTRSLSPSESDAAPSAASGDALPAGTGTRTSPRRLTFLSTFSGLGGLDLGLSAAGFEGVGCIESDPVARATHAANISGSNFIPPHDVIEVARRLKPSDLGLRKGELFALAGGPPCQPFSKAAQWSQTAMKGLSDPRSACLASFVDLIANFLPHTVLIENVQGFVSGRNSALDHLHHGLEKVNRAAGVRYRLHSEVVDASHYGVPQRRKRAILIACRNGASLKFPAPTTALNPVTAWEAFRDLPKVTTWPQRPGHWGQLLPSIPEGSNYLWHTRRGGGKELFGYRTRFWSFLLKLSKNAPAWTIPAHPGPYTGPFHWSNRPLTIAELLRLQSFPSSWLVQGSRIEQVRQIGNATPPLLAEVLGRAVAEQLLDIRYSAPLSLAIPRYRGRIPAPEPLGDIPMEFESLIRPRDDHPGTGRGPAPIRPAPKVRRREARAA